MGGLRRAAPDRWTGHRADRIQGHSMQRRLVGERSTRPLSLQHAVDPSCDLLVVGPTELHLSNRFGGLIRFVALFGFFLDDLGFRKLLYPRVLEQIGVRWAHLRDLMKTGLHKIPRCVGVAFFGQTWRFTLDDGAELTEDGRRYLGRVWVLAHCTLDNRETQTPNIALNAVGAVLVACRRHASA